MQSTHLASVLGAWVLLGTVSSFAQTNADVAAKPENAALKYWQAFGLLPRLEADREKILAERDTVVFDAATQKLIEDTKPSVTFLLRGAALHDCDWGLDLLKDGPQTLMPHLSKARELANHALLHARWHFERRKFAEGVDTATAVMTLARHLGVDGTLISLLVQHSIENQAIQLLARYLPEFTAENHKRMYAKIDALPRGGTIRSAILMEKDGMAGWTLRQFRSENLGVGASLQAIVQAAGGPKGPIKLLEELMPAYEEMARILSLPRSEFEVRWTALSKKLQDNVFARQLLPAVDKIYDADERAKTTWALFSAARSITQQGPDKLKDFPDPIGNEPFAYTVRPIGFELKSKLLYKGQAVKLVVGR